MIKSLNNASDTLKIAATYIGTVVGAGFASGQEVLRFFSVFGQSGIFGIIFTVAFLSLFGYIILWFGHRLQATSYVKVIQSTIGNSMGTFIDIIIILFLIGALAAMIAAGGAIFAEQLHLSAFLGTIVMAVLTLITVLNGLTGVINSLSYIAPILIGTILFIAVHHFINNPLTAEEMYIAKQIKAVTSNWLLSAISYTSFNVIIAIAILAPLGARTKESNSLFFGAMLGAIGLGTGVLAINYSILTTINDSSIVELPMIVVAQQISPFIQAIFTIVLFAGIYSTAVSNLYGLASRLVRNKHQNQTVVIITVIAFSLSQLGFSTMVEYLYPFVGFAGLLLLFGLLYSWLFKRDQF